MEQMKSKAPQRTKKPLPSLAELQNGILKNNLALLSRAITLVESTRPEHQAVAHKLVEHALQQKTDTLRIGITGVPGVGKSTFIEQFGKMITQRGKKVAVLTVDPSSSKSKGSILGDKTRMQALVQDPNAYIRPSASGTSLGGVTRKTRESITLLEAAGYDVIIVETVGVGQSETAVHDMVDFFLLLKLAGAGDELQGIKRGIVEMAHAIAINKADGPNKKEAARAQTEFARALHLFPPKENGWVPKVVCCSALENTGLDALWEMMLAYVKDSKASGYFTDNRSQQNAHWLHQHLEHRLVSDFYGHKSIKTVLPQYLREVTEGKTSPFAAAEALLQRYREE
ncbi:methylmalonyl Co-A mutase-associated GTPase MeaB [Maribacter sp. 2307ULW6-5]|uniref:methylmalonyl Co-A mutase-associated GTPase MeaB n=1 Tax=Maribacter sp. 2307ULW6-5 TaxID=3386275 RepID=UPI0039BC7414